MAAVVHVLFNRIVSLLVNVHHARVLVRLFGSGGSSTASPAWLNGRRPNLLGIIRSSSAGFPAIRPTRSMISVRDLTASI